jgi:hypothetical protein
MPPACAVLASRTLLHLVDLVGDEAVRLAVHVVALRRGPSTRQKIVLVPSSTQ